MSVTKEDLIRYVVQHAGIKKEHARILVNTVLESILDALERGEKVELRGFGSFRVRERKERMAYNPKTGKRIRIKAKKLPYFRPGKALREKLNQKEE